MALKHVYHTFLVLFMFYLGMSVRCRIWIFADIHKVAEMAFYAYMEYSLNYVRSRKNSLEYLFNMVCGVGLWLFVGIFYFVGIFGNEFDLPD